MVNTSKLALYNNGAIIKEKIKGFMGKVDKTGEALPKERIIAATKQLQDTLSILQKIVIS